MMIFDRRKRGNEGDFGFVSFVSFGARFSILFLLCVPLWRGQVVHLAHRGNDYVTGGQKRKTYGSHLVRFFCIKMCFCTIFRRMRRHLVRNLHGINRLQTSQKLAVYMTPAISRPRCFRVFSAQPYEDQWVRRKKLFV
jgi:hypothetical protein